MKIQKLDDFRYHKLSQDGQVSADSLGFGGEHTTHSEEHDWGHISLENDDKVAADSLDKQRYSQMHMKEFDHFHVDEPFDSDGGGYMERGLENIDHVPFDPLPKYSRHNVKTSDLDFIDWQTQKHD